MRQRSTKVRLGLAAAVCLSLVAAACGSDDDGDSADTTAAPPVATEAGSRRHDTRDHRGGPGDLGSRDIGGIDRARRGDVRGAHRQLSGRHDRGARRRCTGQDRLHRPANRAVGRIRRHRSRHEGVLRQDQRRGRRRRRPPDRGHHQGRRVRPGEISTCRPRGARGRQDLRLGVPDRYAERGRHAAVVRRRLCATGARRHRLPRLGRSRELPMDNRRHPLVHRRGEGLGGVHQGEVP